VFGLEAQLGLSALLQSVPAGAGRQIECKQRQADRGLCNEAAAPAALLLLPVLSPFVVTWQ
jgi:hypothetical protein